MNLSTKLNIVTKSKYKGQSKFQFLKDIQAGDLLTIEIPLVSPGRGGNGLYQTMTSIKNHRTEEVFSTGLTMLRKYLDKIEFEEYSIGPFSEFTIQEVDFEEYLDGGEPGMGDYNGVVVRIDGLVVKVYGDYYHDKGDIKAESFLKGYMEGYYGFDTQIPIKKESIAMKEKDFYNLHPVDLFEQKKIDSIKE